MLMDSVGPSAPAPFNGREDRSLELCDRPGAPFPPEPPLPPARGDKALSRARLWKPRAAATLALLELFDCSCSREAKVNSASIFPGGFAGLRTTSRVKRENPINSMR